MLWNIRSLVLTSDLTLSDPNGLNFSVCKKDVKGVPQAPAACLAGAFALSAKTLRWRTFLFRDGQYGTG